jgi:Reverse transcriptase (RNA-dependent DNA polymerase)
LDSHADTCVAGPNTILIAEDGRVVNVFSYSRDKTSNVPIATVATLWESPDGEKLILIIHEALYFGERLKTSTLLTPNQLRANGLVVDDVPRQFKADSTHSIFDPATGIRTPLSIKGQASGFVSHKPTLREWNDCRKVILTSERPWLPNSKAIADAEYVATGQPQPKTTLPETTINHLVEADINVWRASSEPIIPTPMISHGDKTDSIYGDHDSKLYERIVATVIVAADDLVGDGLDGHEDVDVYSMESRAICQLATTERRSVITPEILAQRWSIGLNAAKSTLQATTQAGIRNVFAPGERKLRRRTDHLKYPHLKMTMYSDTMFASKCTATGGHIGAQVYTNGGGYDYFLPIKKKGDAYTTLQTLAEIAGAPKVMVTDGDGALRGEETWLKECRRLGMRDKITVPYSSWQNLAEASIRELKRSVRRAMRRSGSPRKFWNFCGVWCAAIRRLTSMDKLDGRTPTEVVTGTTPDITQYAQFDWYEPIRFLDNRHAFPNEKKLLGRFLGVAEHCTDVMAFRILTEIGTILTRKSVWAITDAEKRGDQYQTEIAKFDKAINTRFGDGVGFDPNLLEHIQDTHIFDGEDEDKPVEPFEPAMLRPELDDLGVHGHEAYDHYLNAEIKRTRGDELHLGTVIGRVRDQNGIPVGRYHENPLLDTREYQVRYANGAMEELTANLINESIMSQVDSAGKHYVMFKDIVDHRTDKTAVLPDDGFTLDRKGRRHRKITTKGWQLLVEWHDGTTEWLPLKDLKESHPIQVAEYAICNKIAEQQAFAYWVREVMRQRDRIIKNVKSSAAFSKNTKFGIRVPRTVKEALEIDRITGTTFWRDAIDKEMAVVRPAFLLDPLNRIPPKHTWIVCHMIFDIKPDLTRKARFVAGGHMTDPPSESVYSSVVTRDSIRIALMHAALNDLRVLIGDIQGAYLYANTEELIWTTCGPEFGSDEGRPAKIVKALYGLKSSGARWREKMASTLRDLDYTSCKADPDVWMRVNTKPSGERYWEFVLMYVDDIMCISHDPQKVMDHIGKVYTLKKGSVGEPTTYLGADIGKYYLPDDPTKVRWSMSSDKYLKRAVKEVELKLGKIDRKLITPAITPFASGVPKWM